MPQDRAELSRHPSAIPRELKRGGSKEGMAYAASFAQQTYHERRTSSLPVGRYTAALAVELNRKLQEMWPPEQIAEEQRAEGKPFVCFKTIYK